MWKEGRSETNLIAGIRAAGRPSPGYDRSEGDTKVSHLERTTCWCVVGMEQKATSRLLTLVRAERGGLLTGDGL
jgi:hypothetical protein